MIICGDALEILKTLPDESVNMCVTSPPYFGLRDYGVDGQIGLEQTPEAYISKLVEVFREVKRVLRDDGTLWVNIGDSYWGSGSRGFDFTGKFKPEISKVQGTDKKYNLSNVPKTTGNVGCYKNKDLIGIPWMLAFALRADGWYLRQDIIWNKPNPMPESVTDRCTKAHEYIFLLSKQPKYYFDAGKIKEPSVTKNDNLRDRETTKLNNCPGMTRMGGLTHNDYETRNKRDVWSVATTPYTGAHFATFPEKLVEPCILSSTKVGGWF